LGIIDNSVLLPGKKRYAFKEQEKERTPYKPFPWRGLSGGRNREKSRKEQASKLPNYHHYTVLEKEEGS